MTIAVPAPAPSADVAPQPDPAGVSVAAVRVPEKLAVDGDFAEWGSLDPPKDVAGKHGGPVGPAPRPAASHVAVALGPSFVALAADLREGAREGIWLGVRFEWNGVPVIGGYDPFRGVMSYDCDKVPFDRCAKLMRARQEVAERLSARFVRVFRVHGDGVRERLADGTLRSVTKVSAQPSTLRIVRTSTALRVEAVLPLAMLPAADVPAVDAVGLAARPASASPRLAEDAYAWLDLPSAVRFEPHAALRQRVHELFVTDGRRLVYNPGKPDVTLVTYLGYAMDHPSADTSRLLDQSENLYTPRKTLGTVEATDRSLTARCSRRP